MSILAREPCLPCGTFLEIIDEERVLAFVGELIPALWAASHHCGTFLEIIDEERVGTFTIGPPRLEQNRDLLFNATLLVLVLENGDLSAGRIRMSWQDLKCSLLLLLVRHHHCMVQWCAGEVVRQLPFIVAGCPSLGG
jgi:hypothetical protein